MSREGQDKMRYICQLSCVAALLPFAFIQHTQAQAQAQFKVSPAISTIQLQDGQLSAPVTLVFKVSGLKKEQMSLVPEVKPVSASEGGPGVVVTGTPTALAKLDDGAFWQVPAHVSGLTLNSKFTAVVLVRLDKLGEVVTYDVTNLAPAVDADVSPGSDTIFLQNSRDTDFIVNVKGRPLRALSVCQSALADPNTGDHLGGQYLGLYLEPLGVAANPDAGNPYLTLSAPSTRVHLFISRDFHDNGVFAGTVGLCSASKAAVSILKLTVNSSSCAARIAGAFFIVAGIGLYVLVIVVLKQRSRQLTALLPASRLVEGLNGLRNSAKDVAHRAGVELPVLLGDETVEHSLQWLIAQLSVAKLKEAGYLPSLLTNPFLPPDAGTDYQQYLQSISAQELNDAIIVGDGLQRVMSLWQQLDEESARQALTKLDQLALEADSSIDPMRPKVDALVSGIAPSRQELAQMLLVAHDNFRASGGTPPSVHEITVQLDYVSGIGWVIWALLTFLLGCGVLILSNHGFGTWQDLFKCFLWGIGIQAAGQGLQALSPSSTATTFSLQIGH
jgi:hypothetical protein